MTTWMLRENAKPLVPCCGERSDTLRRGLIEELFNRRNRQTMLLLSVAFILAALPNSTRAQSIVPSTDSAVDTGTTIPARVDLTYERPTQRTLAGNYVFEAFGPYPIAGAAVSAAVGQYSNAPPEWRQGVKGYARRFGSDFGIAAVGTTARYGLAEALKEDTLYYRCDCRGVLPRLRHAVFSTLTARRGEGGHRVFSIPALVAPYAGSMTAVYGWYPNRFDARDGFRIGNYDMLAYVGGNIALEFFYSGRHSLLSRMHLNNPHGAPDPGPNHSEPNN